MLKPSQTEAEYLTLAVTVIDARLPPIASPVSAYVAVEHRGLRYRTRTLKDCGQEPSWNHTFEIH